MATLDTFFAAMNRQDASDLHVADGAITQLRIDGVLEPIGDGPNSPPIALESELRSLLTVDQWRTFQEHGELDFGHALQDGTRLRVNCYRHHLGLGAAFRRIPDAIRTCDKLGVPEVVARMADAPEGLVLLAGPTGCGKSTTMAALVDRVNRTQQRHIIAVEEPIEYMHLGRKSRILQREVPTHTPTFARGVVAAKRQDPDVLVVGELRDLESTRATIEAADRGVLVFATVHCNGAAGAVDRIVDMFPDDERDSARTALASALRGVVAQQLLRRRDRQGRVAVFEVLVGSPAVSAMVRAGDTARLFSHVQSGASSGMRTLDQALHAALRDGLIERDEAIRCAENKDEFRRQ